MIASQIESLIINPPFHIRTPGRIQRPKVARELMLQYPFPDTGGANMTADPPDPLTNHFSPTVPIWPGVI